MGSVFNNNMGIRMRISILGILFLIACQKSGSGEHLPSNVRPVKKHWESAWPEESLPANIPSLNAASCGACHTAIYEDWKSTTHANAYVDLQYQAEIKKDGLSMCINCHSPLLNQQQFQVKGFIDGDYKKPFKVPNKSFDSSLQSEGITCAVCHVRGGKIVGPRGTGLAPHPVKKDSTFFMSLCMQCHNAQDVVSKTLVCTFNTGDDWKAGPYAKNGKNCLDCHMPTSSRPLAVGGKIYHDSRMHTWPGMGIAKFIGDLASVSAQYKPGLNVEIKMDSSISAGKIVEFGVNLTNMNAGHEIPTGDPERFVQVLLQIKNPDGSLVAERREKIGETWKWYPEAKKLADNSMKVKEKRFIGLPFIPKYARARLLFSVEVSNHRITEGNASSMKLGKEYPRDIVVFKDSKSFSIH